MSWKILAKVYDRRIGSVLKKAVMTYCADKASDDGTGIWASKPTIATALEAGRSSVFRAINELVRDGILVPVGSRKCATGATVKYRIDIDVLLSLPTAKTTAQQSLLGQDPSESGTGLPQDPSGSETPPVPDQDAHPSNNGTQTTLGTSLEQVASRSSGARKLMACPNRSEIDALLDELIVAVGHKRGNLTKYWLPNAALPHITRWMTDLGLTHEEIVSTARQSRQQHNEPPSGPKALDRAMQAVANAKAARPMTPHNQYSPREAPLHLRLRPQVPKEYQNEK